MKEIPGFSQYLASDDGQIFNKGGWGVSPYLASGYLQIKLKADDGRRRSIGVHRCVVSAYLGAIPPKMWVNHKNGIKTDNRLSNLEVDTPSHNHCHARDVLKRRYLRGPEHANAKLSQEGIEAVIALNHLGWSQHRIAKALGVSQPAISLLLKRD